MIILVELVNLKYHFFYNFFFEYLSICFERKTKTQYNQFILFYITILFLHMKNMHWPDIDPVLESNKKKGHILYKSFKMISFFFLYELDWLIHLTGLSFFFFFSFFFFNENNVNSVKILNYVTIWCKIYVLLFQSQHATSSYHIFK